MIRVLLFLGLCPACLAAQNTWVGLRVGRNIADLQGDRTRSGAALGVFTQTRVSGHVDLEWGVDWMRSAVDGLEPSSPAPSSVGEPEYLTTNLTARVSAARSFSDASRITLGAAAFGGGWLGMRSGGHVPGADPRRLDFGQVWGVSVFAARAAVKLEASLRAYHGEREVWVGGPRQRGARALIGIAYRVR